MERNQIQQADLTDALSLRETLATNLTPETVTRTAEQFHVSKDEARGLLVGGFLLAETMTQLRADLVSAMTILQTHADLVTAYYRETVQ